MTVVIRLLLLLFSLTLLTLSAQEISECSADEAEKCLAVERVCYQFESNGTSSCGYCRNGFLEIKIEEGRTCYDIEAIPTSAFVELASLVEEYLPQYANASESLDVRAQRLQALARVVSFWNSQVPPPAFRLGITRETFLTEAERRGRLGASAASGPAVRASEDGGGKEMQRFVSERRLLAEEEPAVDWEQRGALTPVKNQGICGCCWAVSTVAAIESAFYITNSSATPPQQLSFQQMISCDYDNAGCNGGNILLATRYAWENNDFSNGDLGGLISLDDYPYSDFLGKTTTTCQSSTKQPLVYLNSPKIVTSVNDRSSFQQRVDLTKAALSQQPISSVLKSGCNLFMSYTGGVLTHDDGCQCCEVSCIDHAVVIVGYNTTSNPPYWKLRNSWGREWGEDGYFRIAMDEPGCGWGLFGLLAESALPADVYGSLDELPVREKRSWWDKAQNWEKALVIVASVLGGCGCLCCIVGLIAKKRNT